MTAWIQPRGSSPAQGRTGSGVGRCGDLEEAVVAAADAVGRKRRARDVTSEALELHGILRRERFSGKNGEPPIRRSRGGVPRPAASGVTSRRSNQLNYAPALQQWFASLSRTFLSPAIP